MMELILALGILLLMIGYLVLDQRQYESRIKQSYDEGFRDGMRAITAPGKLTVEEVIALKKEMD